MSVRTYVCTFVCTGLSLFVLAGLPLWVPLYVCVYVNVFRAELARLARPAHEHVLSHGGMLLCRHAHSSVSSSLAQRVARLARGGLTPPLRHVEHHADSVRASRRRPGAGCCRRGRGLEFRRCQRRPDLLGQRGASRLGVPHRRLDPHDDRARPGAFICGGPSSSVV